MAERAAWTSHARSMASIAAAVTLTLVAWAWFGLPATDQIQFGADQALLVRDALDVQQGTPVLLGAYSKSGVHHPGPLYQWLLAAVLAACGNDVARAATVLSLVQWSTVGLMVLAVSTITRSTAVACGTVVLAFANPTFAIYAQMIWNPSIVFPAAAAALLVTLKIAEGRRALLPILGALVSLMMQAHVGTVPVAAALLAAGTWWALAARVSDRTAPDPGRRHHVSSARRDGIALVLTLMALWTPPVIEAWRHGGGNMRALWVLGRQDRAWHAWAEVWHAVQSIIAESLPVNAWALLLVLPLGVAAMSRGAPTATRRGVMLTAVFTLAFVLSVASIPGVIETYYLRYATVVLPLALGLAWSGTCRLLPSSRAWRATVTGALMVLVAALTWQTRPWVVVPHTLRAPVVTPFPLSDIGTAAALVQSGVTSRTPTVTVQTRLATHVHGRPCPFVSDADIAFAVGRAVAEMVGCDASRTADRPRYRLAAAQSPSPEGGRDLFTGRAFRLVVVP